MANISALPFEHAYSPDRDEATLLRAAHDEPEAFGELCTRYAPRLYGYLRARTNSDEDAADLTQQVFVRATAAFPRYRDRGAPFGAWLFRIARNLLTDAHRRNRVTVSWDRLPEAFHWRSDDDVEATVVQREAYQRVRMLLADLKDQERELILLRFVAGLTLREIAATVGKSEAGIHRQIKQTLRTIQERYDADE